MEFDTKTLILQAIKLSVKKTMEENKVVVEQKLIIEAMQFFHTEYNFVLKCIKELAASGIIIRKDGFIYIPGYEVKLDISDI